MISPTIQIKHVRKFFQTLRVMDEVTPVAAMLNIPVMVTKSAQPIERPMILPSVRSLPTLEGCSPNNGANGKYNMTAMRSP